MSTIEENAGIRDSELLNGLDSGFEPNVEILEEPVLNGPMDNGKPFNFPSSPTEEASPLAANHFLRPNRPKKRDFFAKSHSLGVPKRLRKHRATNKTSEAKHEENCREIHLKEEENTDKKLFYHSYASFATIMQYLEKFEWFNNASFQNKQLPSSINRLKSFKTGVYSQIPHTHLLLVHHLL